MLRFIDIILSTVGIFILFPIFLLVYLLCYIDTKSPLFFQTRVGKNRQPFTLVKFRTMKTDTESVASHLAPTDSITKLGKFLRKSKLDELPQLVNVLMGSMSFVGPRPNLTNQEELILERDKLGVYNVRPGITGRAQLMNIDMSKPSLLAKVDKEMIDELSITSYIKYIFLTALGKGSGDAVKQKDS